MASLAWMARARCLAYADDFEMLDRLMFADRSGKSGKAGKKAVPFGAAGVARRICAGCPVRRDCLEYSLDLEGASHWAVSWDAKRGRVLVREVTPEVDGMWGGILKEERRSTRDLPRQERLAALEAIFEAESAKVLLPSERVA